MTIKKHHVKSCLTLKFFKDFSCFPKIIMLDSARIDPVNCWDLNLKSIEDCVVEVMDDNQEASCKKLFDVKILQAFSCFP